MAVIAVLPVLASDRQTVTVQEVLTAPCSSYGLISGGEIAVASANGAQLGHGTMRVASLAGSTTGGSCVVLSTLHVPDDQATYVFHLGSAVIKETRGELASHDWTLGPAVPPWCPTEYCLVR
jgi:hypothetical protein